MFRRSVFARVLALTLLVGVAAVGVEGASILPASAAFAPQLTRYPYLTDVVQGNATINWATDTSGTKASVTYGKAGLESCSAHKVTASKTTITVKSTTEYQWKAKLSGSAAEHSVLLPRSAGHDGPADRRHTLAGLLDGHPGRQPAAVLLRGLR